MIKRNQRFKTTDSGLAFFVNELDNLDRRPYQPLTEVSWGRDIKLRGGISASDESTSFIQLSFAAPGTLLNVGGQSPGDGPVAGGIPWISAESTTLPGISVDGQRLVAPLRWAGREVSYSSIEIERSKRLGTSLDVLKMDSMNIAYQKNIDQMVYVGDPSVQTNGGAVYGLFNNASVSQGLVATGFQGTTFWAQKTPDEILNDVNTLIYNTYANSGFAVCPSELRLPPLQFGYIASQKVSSAGNVSILKFLEDNSLSLKINGKALNIQPVKWLGGLGYEGTNRMAVYTNEENRVRFPMVPIMRQTPYYYGIRFTAPYIFALGQVEFVYPETVSYADGI